MPVQRTTPVGGEEMPKKLDVDLSEVVYVRGQISNEDEDVVHMHKTER